MNRCWCILLPALTFGPLAAKAAPRIAAIEFESPLVLDKEALATRSGLLPGQDASPARLNAAVHALAEGGAFEQVLCYLLPGEEGVVVHFKLLPYLYLRGITITGNLGLSEALILETLQLKLGLPPPSDTSALAARIKELYYNQGFFKAQVTIEQEVRGAGLHLRVTVKEYARATLRKVHLEGFGPLTQEIESILNLHVGKPFRPTMLPDRTRKVQKLLFKRGYPMARLDKPVFSFDRIKNRVDLKLVCNLAERFQLLTVGNEALDDEELRAFLSLDRLSYFTPSTAEHWAGIIKEEYRHRGFPFAEVKAEVTQDEEHITVTLLVTEHEYFELDELTLSGQQTLDPELLTSMIRAYASEAHGEVYYFLGLRRALDRVEQHFHAEGYPDFVLTITNIALADGEATIDLEVDEGVPRLLAALRFRGNQFFTSEELAATTGLQLGKVYAAKASEEARKKVLTEYHRRGFIDAQVTCTETAVKNQITLELELSEGLIAYLGEVRISGALRTKPAYILRKFPLRRDDPLDLLALDKAKDDISRLGLFTSVRIIDHGTIDADRHHDLEIVVVEDNAIRLEFGTGIGTEDTTGGIIRFEENKVKVFAETSHANLLGTGKLGYAYGELNRRIPEARILGRKLQTGFVAREAFFEVYDYDANILHERQDQKNFDYDRNSLIQGLSRQVSEKFRTNVQYEFEYLKTFNISGQSERDAFLGRNTDWERLGSINLILFLENRNNRLDPTRGTYTRATFSFFDHLFASQRDFFKVEARQDLFLPLGKSLNTNLTLRSGYGRVLFGEVHIPIIEQYYLGGTGSLRGFEEDSITPYPNNDFVGNITWNLYLNYLAELVFPLYKNFKGAVFHDGGEVLSNSKPMGSLDLRTGAGLGLRYQTPVGPLKLDYGIALDRKPGEAFGNLHFSIGFFF